MFVHRIQNLLIVLILAQVPCEVAAEDYESNLIVALDFSTSYYGADRFASIEDNFFKLLDAMDSRRLKKPLLFQVIPIDHISQAGGALCKDTICAFYSTFYTDKWGQTTISMS